MKTNKRKPMAVLSILTGMLGLLVLFVVAWTVRAGSVERVSDAGPIASGQPMPGVYNSSAMVSGPAVLPPSAPASTSGTMAAAPPVPASIALLDRRRQFALGMIETGNRDGEIGQAGEVSRYQIMPSVWKHYSDSSGYRDPEVSLAVARQHWAALCSSFKQQAHREPDDFDMYVLWNTRYGYYASKDFRPARLHPVVRDRAQRFVNLLARGGL